MDLIASTTLAGLKGSLDSTNVALNTLWVVVAAILVMFMQAGSRSWRWASPVRRTRARWSPRC